MGVMKEKCRGIYFAKYYGTRMKEREQENA